eukprot:5445760-Lingulodinium_polyedra.AAC.1
MVHNMPQVDPKRPTQQTPGPATGAWWPSATATPAAPGAARCAHRRDARSQRRRTNTNNNVGPTASSGIC